MKMKQIFWMCGLLCLASCFKDETTDGDGAISEIIIEEGSVRDEYDIDKNETLVIHPVIRQTNQDKPVTYTWEIDLKAYSHEEDFVYVGNRLGAYQCRLIVENEDGKTFFPFKLNVNSPYEEGITVLSSDKEGHSMLSFMLKQREAGVEDHFDEGDCFSLNNPDMDFAPNVADMVQCDGSLIVACQGKGTADCPGTIYYLNEKTFVVENMLTAPEYPEFKPTRLCIPANGYAGVSYPILSENGAVYEFSTSESALTQALKFQSRYAQASVVYSGTNRYNIVLWDEEVGGLCQLMNNYGPYYCSNTYLCSQEQCTGSVNYFNGMEFVTMCMPRLPQNASSEEIPMMVVVVRNGTLYYKVVMFSGFWRTNMETLTNVLYTEGGLKICNIGNCNLTNESPMVASRVYYALLYGDGNKVYKWNYTTSQFLNQVPQHAEVGTANAVITAMELSLDQTETFVAFYEPEEEGLNGHVWVIDTDRGTVLRKYDNVCYRPVKIMYKKR